MQSVKNFFWKKLILVDFIGRMDRRDIVVRILLNSCPKCKYPKIMDKKGGFSDRCPSCDLLFQRESGFMLGAMPVSYLLTFFCWVLPCGILWFYDCFSETLLWCLLIPGILIFPLAVIRFSRLLWMATYFAFLPHLLDEKE